MASSAVLSDAERVELSGFNAAVSHWSNQFSPELRGIAYTVGSRMGWDHNSFPIVWDRLLYHHAKFCDPVSLVTFRKYCRIWQDQGGLKMTTDWRETNASRGTDKKGQHRGGARMNSERYIFTVDFSVVVKSRRVFTGKQGRPVTEYYTEPWTFGQAAPFHEEFRFGYGEPTIAIPAVDGQLTGNGPAIDPYSSFDCSGTSWMTPSSPQADDDDPSTKSNINLTPNAPLREASGEDWSWDQIIPWVARKLGVDLEEIKADRFVSDVTRHLKRYPDADLQDVFGRALIRMDGHPQFNPPGYFLSILPTAFRESAQVSRELSDDELPADGQEDAATRQAIQREEARVRQEIESFRENFRAIDHEDIFRYHLREWRGKGVPDDKILARLPKTLKSYEEMRAERIASIRRQLDAEREGLAGARGKLSAAREAIARCVAPDVKPDRDYWHEEREALEKIKRREAAIWLRTADLRELGEDPDAQE